MRLISGLLVFAVMTGGFNLLQMYRDNTRYGYFRAPTDLNSFQRISVDGWEFLDKPGEKKTIAMAMAWEPPGHKWILYPLLGRWLQNDIVYISAKYRWDVPSWLDQGMLRGNDVSIWVSNLKDKHVDYVVVSDPIAYPFLKTRAELMHGLWPIELFWMKNDPDTFRLVYTDGYCRIFEYLK